VLTLIDLSLLEGRVRIAEPVRRHPHLAEHPGLIPVEQLWSHYPDAGRGSGRLHELGNGVRRQGRVVVEQQDVVGRLRHGGGERATDGGGEPLVALQPEHPLGGQGGYQDLGRAVGRTVVYGNHAEPGMGLAGQGGKRPREPCGPILDHEDDQDAWGGVLHVDPGAGERGGPPRRPRSGPPGSISRAHRGGNLWRAGRGARWPPFQERW
jgi:hypothetical protein